MDFACNVLGIDGVQRRRAGRYQHPTDSYSDSACDDATPSDRVNCAVGCTPCNGNRHDRVRPIYAHPGASNSASERQRNGDQTKYC